MLRELIVDGIDATPIALGQGVAGSGYRVSGLICKPETRKPILHSALTKLQTIKTIRGIIFQYCLFRWGNVGQGHHRRGGQKPTSRGPSCGHFAGLGRHRQESGVRIERGVMVNAPHAS